MLCSRCGKNPANKKIKTQEGDAEYLCEECYRSDCARKPKREEGRVCPNCGTTLAEFRRTGLVGCADCYRAFRDEILPFLQRTQAGVSHEGKVQTPFTDDDYEKTRALVREHDLVRAELEQAILHGNQPLIEELQARMEELHVLLFPKGTAE